MMIMSSEMTEAGSKALLFVSISSVLLCTCLKKHEKAHNKFINLGPLHICDSCVAWSIHGTPPMGAGTVPGALIGSWEPILYAQPEGQSLVLWQLAIHALLTSMGGLPLSERIPRRGGSGCKINKYILKRNSNSFPDIEIIG